MEDTLARRRLLCRFSRSRLEEIDPAVLGRDRGLEVMPSRPMPGPIPILGLVLTSPVPGRKFLPVTPGM